MINAVRVNLILRLFFDCPSTCHEYVSVNFRYTVESIRAQRAFSIQMPEQYVFCHIAFLEWALEHGNAPDAEADLTGFESGSEFDEDA